MLFNKYFYFKLGQRCENQDPCANNPCANGNFFVFIFIKFIYSGY